MEPCSIIIKNNNCQDTYITKTMKKYSQLIWNQYKNSEQGKVDIARFREAYSSVADANLLYALARKYNPRFFENADDDQETEVKEELTMLKDFLSKAVPEEVKYDIVGQYEEKKAFFQWLISYAIDEEDEDFVELPQRNFKYQLFANIIRTWTLYQFLPQAFLPNLFALQFHYLARFAKEYEIELPPVPSRSAYKDRCMYYVELNNVLQAYAYDNGITQPEEMCAFWFGLALPLAKEQIEADRNKLPEMPEQAWLLVGNYGENERDMISGFWQANPMTVRGDVMLFYEKSPIKALNSVWIAMDDGVADPFFHYMGYSWISHKIEIPESQSLTYQDFKNSEYFINRDKKGNFVSKNFQDCSGWAVTFEDYAEIKRMLEAKGFDTSALPRLYEPEGLSAEDIHTEKDVYEKLVTPMLEQMGWKEGVDFFREVEFAAGHSTTGHAMNKRPDYCLHMRNDGHKVYAKVVIEAKYHMQNKKELAETFDQCLSYARWGNAKVMVLCDKNSIYVYEQDASGQFNPTKNVTRYRWEQLSNLEFFKKLKYQLK